jgi:hypothetical protein
MIECRRLRRAEYVANMRERTLVGKNLERFTWKNEKEINLK